MPPVHMKERMRSCWPAGDGAQSVASREVNTLDSVVLSVTRIEESHGTCCRRASSWKGRHAQQ